MGLCLQEFLTLISADWETNFSLKTFPACFLYDSLPLKVQNELLDSKSRKKNKTHLLEAEKSKYLPSVAETGTDSYP